MNCEQFQRRLDSLLDNHQDVGADPALQQHSHDCDDCAERLMIWTQIETCIVSRPQSHNSAWYSLFAVAAAILFCVTLATQNESDRSEPPTLVATGEPSAEQVPWDSAVFWTAMRKQDWVDHTMPAMDSMARGVAPIGRSVKQAAAILLNQVDSSSPTLVEPATPGEQTTEFVVFSSGVIT